MGGVRGKNQREGRLEGSVRVEVPGEPWRGLVGLGGRPGALAREGLGGWRGLVGGAREKTKSTRITHTYICIYVDTHTYTYMSCTHARCPRPTSSNSAAPHRGLGARTCAATPARYTLIGTRSAIGAPASARLLRVVTARPGSLRAVWRPPEDDGGAQITAYLAPKGGGGAPTASIVKSRLLASLCVCTDALRCSVIVPERKFWGCRKLARSVGVVAEGTRATRFIVRASASRLDAA